MNRTPRPIDLTASRSPSGLLVALQQTTELPFAPRRLFAIAKVPQGQERANHANQETQMALVTIVGSCRIDIHDGSQWHRFALDTPDRGLYCPRMTWKRIYDFAPGTVLIAVCDTLYDPEEYIDDFEVFLSVAQEHDAP